MLSETERKDVVRAVVRDALADEAPTEMEDFPRVFDGVYAATELDLATMAQAHPGEGLPFDPSFVAGTVLGTLVWTACALVHSRLSTASRPEGAGSRESSSAADGGDRVARLDERIGRLMNQLTTLEGKLDSREGRIAARPVVEGPLEAVEGMPRPASRLTLLTTHHRGDDQMYLVGYRLVGTDARGHEVVRRFSSRILREDPGRFVGRKLRTGVAVDPEQIRKLGIFLGERLIPPKLAQALLDESGPRSSLLILSDEPELAWEVVRLPGGSPPEGPALADAFAVAQWPGDHTPAPTLTARRIGVVAPEDSGLPEVGKEVDFLFDLAQGGREVVRIPARLHDVLEALTGGGFGVIHVSGHGLASGDDADSWYLALEDGERLNALSLAGESLGDPPPLVVLNSCWLGRGGWSLGGFGGIAAALVEAGAGAVIGARWPISDRLSRKFTESFYPLFLSGHPLGDAVRRSRSALGSGSTSAPTRLAYTVLGDPAACCLPATASIDS